MKSFDPKTDRVAILAGGGGLPGEILNGLADNKTLTPLMIGIRGEVDPDMAEKADRVLGYGQLGTLFDLLSQENIRHVVFAGSIDKRPDWAAIKPDLTTLKELPNLVKIAFGGDNSVLEKIAAFLAKKDIDLIGAHVLAPQLLCPEGILARRLPKKNFAATLAVGMKAAKMLGALDAGQAIVAEDGRIVALEGAEGTDAMLERVCQLRRIGRLPKASSTGILIKAMKPGQYEHADLPTIGPRTIERVKAAGLAGIVVEAGRSLILKREETVKAAKRASIFILGRDFDAEQ